MKKLKLIDGIIKEPIGGAHSEIDKVLLKLVKNTIIDALEELKDLNDTDLVAARMINMLKWEFIKNS